MFKYRLLYLKDETYKFVKYFDTLEIFSKDMGKLLLGISM